MARVAAMSGLWAGGYPAAVMTMLMSWVLALTWLVAGRQR